MHIIIILVVAVLLGVAGTFYYKPDAVTVSQAPEPAPVTEAVPTAQEEVPPPIDTEADAVPASEPSSSAPESKPAPTPAPKPATTPVVAHAYKDGTYSATGTYTSPAGKENVMISVTIKDDVVTSAAFNGQSDNGTSDRYIDRFNAGYTSLVVGKKLDSIQLTVVNGASLVPRGFMDALTDVKAEAKA